MVIEVSCFFLSVHSQNCTHPGGPPGFPGGSVVKNLPAMQETQERRVGCLSLEAPLEKEMATHSTICAWKIPWLLQSMGSQKSPM